MAQSGGPFQITQSVIAPASGTTSGAQFSLDSTVAESAAGGPVTGGAFAITSGFWTFTPLAPTAANVAVGGRILTADGRGIRNVFISLTQIRTGAVRAAISSSFGNYRFDDLPVGESYLLTVRAKSYQFDPDTRLITLLDEMTDQDFIALPQ